METDRTSAKVSSRSPLMYKFRKELGSYKNTPYKIIGGQQFYKEGNRFFVVYVPHNIESCGKLPALMYQTSYGCTYLAEGLVLEKIAVAGFIVVTPQRENETNAPQNRTDGKDLLSALDFLQEEDAKGSGALIEGHVDFDALGAGGFSMGGPAALNAAAARPELIKVLIETSPSLFQMAIDVYEMREIELLKKAKELKMPSLWQTCEGDVCHDGVVEYYGHAASPATFIKYTAEAAQPCRNMENFYEHTFWGKVGLGDGPVDPLGVIRGDAQEEATDGAFSFHVAIGGGEVADPSTKHVIAFLKQIFCNGDKIEKDETIMELVSK